MTVTWWSGSVRMVNAFRTSPLEAYPLSQSALGQKFEASREQSVSAVVGLPRWFNTSLPHWSPSTNCTCESWIFGVNIRLLLGFILQSYGYKLVWSKKAHSHPIESITYDNVHHRLALTSGNQIKVGALGDNGKCCRHIKHGMIITLFSDELTFLWSHTSTSKTLATAIQFINPNSGDGYVSQPPNVSWDAYIGVYLTNSIIQAQNDGWYGDHLQEKYLPSRM